MKGYLVGVDIGTQGTKAILFDTDMNVVASAFEVSNLISPKPGTVWQEAEDIYMSCVRTIKEIIDKSKIDSKDILGIGIDGQMAGIMGIDKDGEAATYYDSWLDMRCGKYMDEMKKVAGKRVIEITGGPVTYVHGPKILWWKGERPDEYKNIYKFVLPHGYVAGKMAGLNGDRAYFDYTCIQYSGFGDNEKLEWSDELLETFGVEKSKFPRIVSPFEVVGKATKEFAALSGVCEGTPIVAGAGDTAASVFGAGVFEPGMTLDCAGTASVMCSIVDKYAADTENETITMVRTPIDNLWMPLAYINGGGLCVRWFRDNFSGKPAASYDELESEAKEIAPGSEGALFVPHFAGRVLPNNPYVRGSFVGLDWKHTRGHLYKAIMEGIAYEYKFYLSILKKLYPERSFDKLSIIGGGSKSKLFNSVKADVLGMDVSTFELGDTALVGSAVIAGVGAGVFNDYKAPITKVIKEGMHVKHNEENTRAYEKYAKEYLEVIKSLENVYKSDVYGI